MKKLILLLLPVLFFAISCESGNDPKEEMKNPREFTWEADTIYYPESYQTIIYSTWANSEIDIYAVGHTDVNEGAFWHYNGDTWEMIRIFDHIDRGVLSFLKVFALSTNQVWIVGNRGSQLNTTPVIWTYNGHAIFEKRLDEYGGRLRSIHGTDRHNIWACGDSGLVAHFNGIEWSTDNVELEIDGIGSLFLEDIVADNENAYMLVTSYYVSTLSGRRFCVKGNIGSWNIISDANTGPSYPTEWGYKHLYMSSWNSIYSHTHGVFRLIENEWVKDITFFGGNTPTRDMSGCSADNIIFVGDYSKAYHWNGADVFIIPELEGEVISSYNCVELFSDQAFIFGHTDSFPQKTIVYHGK